VPNNQVNAMLDATPRAVASMGSAYPAGVAGHVATRMALGALSVPFPQPSAQAAAPKPAPKAAPETPLQAVERIRARGPRKVDRGFMTDSQWTQAKNLALQEHRQELEAAERGVSLPDKARKGKADADIAVSDSEVRPELNRIKPKKAIADLQNTRAQRDLAIGTTPTKVKQGKATLTKTEQETKLAREREGRAERQAREQERHNKAMEEQARRAEARLVANAERELATKSGDKALDSIKTQLAKQLSRYQAKRQLASGSTVPAEEPGVRDKIGKEIERLMQRLREVEKTGGPTSVTTTRRTGGTQRASSSSRNAPVLGRGAAKPRLPKGVDDSDYKAVSGLISGGKFDGFARGLKGPARAQAKAIYKHKTGRDWGG
jgi:hypothetical protein